MPSSTTWSSEASAKSCNRVKSVGSSSMFAWKMILFSTVFSWGPPSSDLLDFAELEGPQPTPFLEAHDAVIDRVDEDCVAEGLGGDDRPAGVVEFRHVGGNAEAIAET